MLLERTAKHEILLVHEAVPISIRADRETLGEGQWHRGVQFAEIAALELSPTEFPSPITSYVSMFPMSSRFYVHVRNKCLLSFRDKAMRKYEYECIVGVSDNETELTRSRGSGWNCSFNGCRDETSLVPQLHSKNYASASIPNDQRIHLSVETCYPM